MDVVSSYMKNNIPSYQSQYEMWNQAFVSGDNRNYRLNSSKVEEATDLKVDERNASPPNIDVELHGGDLAE